MARVWIVYGTVPALVATEFGIGIQQGGAINSTEVTDLGADWIRTSMRWITAQGSSGSTYDWTTHDQTATEIEAIGIKAICAISNAPAWSRPSTSDNANDYPSLAYPELLDYVNAVTTRYSTIVTAWELWNEPRLHIGWETSNYTKFVNDAVPIIQSAASTALIIAPVSDGSFAEADSTTHDLYYQTILASSGFLQSVDALSMHIYSHEVSPYSTVYSSLGPAADRLDNSIAFVSSLGWTGPIHITESGWRTASGSTTDATEAQQAEYITELANIAWKRNIVLHVFKLWGSSSTSDGSASYGIISSDGSHKPAYEAYQRFITTHKSTFVPAFFAMGTGYNDAATNGNPTPIWPSTVWAGQTAIMFGYVKNNAAGTLTASTAWLLLGTNASQGSDQLYAWKYIGGALGTESTTVETITAVSTVGRLAAIITLFDGVDTVENYATQNSSTSATIVDLNITSTGSKRLAVNAFGYTTRQTGGQEDLTGETGGSWTPVAYYEAGANPTLSVQTAYLSTAGTIGGGTATPTPASNSMVIGFSMYQSTVGYS